MYSYIKFTVSSLCKLFQSYSTGTYLHMHALHFCTVYSEPFSLTRTSLLKLPIVQYSNCLSFFFSPPQHNHNSQKTYWKEKRSERISEGSLVVYLSLFYHCKQTSFKASLIVCISQLWDLMDVGEAEEPISSWRYRCPFLTITRSS